MDQIISIDKIHAPSQNEKAVNGADRKAAPTPSPTEEHEFSSLLQDYERAIAHYREFYTKQQKSYHESSMGQRSNHTTPRQVDHHRQYLTYLGETLQDCEQACTSLSHLTGKARKDYLQVWKKHMEALLKTHGEFIREIEHRILPDTP